jgi:hypothetical protein
MLAEWIFWSELYLYEIALLLHGFLDANINISLKGNVRGVVNFRVVNFIN